MLFSFPVVQEHLRGMEQIPNKHIRMGNLKICTVIAVIISCGGVQGLLYPRDSESRQTKSLDGIWNFLAEPKGAIDVGLNQQWYSKPLSESGATEFMPVPSSYQDLSNDRERRDFFGWVWYDREFWVPPQWDFATKRIFLRFSSVNYYAIVWVNGIKVTEHQGGHLPFESELTLGMISFTQANRITVAVNNTLTDSTVPQGFVRLKTGDNYPPGHTIMQDNFDFFKYAGIQRSVVLYTTPRNYIEDITVTTNVVGTTGQVSYTVVGTGEVGESVVVDLIDKSGQLIATASTFSGQLAAPNAKLWWPYTMVANASDAGYLYTLKVALTRIGVTDVYRLKIGIRTVKWSTTSFLINDQPFYFTGFGRHEDFFLHGRGYDPVLMIKDHNLIKWTGANSYRTTHYPYSEELMDLVDELGIVIIDECSAVSLTEFGPELLEVHKEEMTQLIKRDKNHPSVVMWSVANEPRSEDPNAENYFREIFAHTRTLDSTRPVAIVLFTNYANDKAAQFADILGLNRYHAWYSDVGELEIVMHAARNEAMNWMTTYNKPLIYTEYGADTVAGLHMSPSWLFTEEWQEEYMREHFKAFDAMRRNTSVTFIGEMIWNFADFMTKQEITRIVGNRKGIFTRDRQPKASAHLLRTRYHYLANEFFDYPVPDDLHQSTPIYIDGNKQSQTCPKI